MITGTFILSRVIADAGLFEAGADGVIIGDSNAASDSGKMGGMIPAAGVETPTATCGECQC